MIEKMFSSPMLGKGYKATKDNLGVIYEIRRDYNKRRKNCHLYINDVLIMKNQDESTIYRYLYNNYRVVLV